MKASLPPRPADPPATPAPEVRIPRALAMGSVFIALPILLHALLLPVWGEGATPLFIVFMLSLLPGTGACFVYAGGNMLRIAYAMIILVGAAFLSLWMVEARIFGPVPSLQPAEAPAHRAAAGFFLPGAGPRTDLAREVRASVTLPQRDLRGRSVRPAELRGRFTVVPVVGPDWTPAQPVPVVAVLDHGPDSVARSVPGAPWESGRGVLRLLPDPLRDHAVRQALSAAGWTAAPNVVVGRWVADPGWARLDAAGLLLWLLGAALLGWALVILSGHPWVAARFGWMLDEPESQRPGASLPVSLAIVQGSIALGLPSLVALGLRHAGIEPFLSFFAICCAAIPSLIVAIRAFGSRTPIGITILGFILMLFIPLAVLARGAGPNGSLPNLTGARWADVQEAMIVLGVGCLVWAALVIVGNVMERRAGSGAPR